MTFFPGGTANVVLAGPGAEADLPERAWHLSEHWRADWDEGVTLAPGWSGFVEPKGTHQWFKTARGDGAIWLGAVIEPREFSIPMYVHKTQGKPFHYVDDSVWQDIDYEFQSRLYVNTPRGTRFVDLRLADEPNIVHEKDPAFDGFMPYLAPVVVERPWWMGMIEEHSWVNGKRPRKLLNTGDRKAWPVHLAKGPGVFQIPDGNGEVVVTTPNLAAGEIALFDSDPSKKTALSNKRSRLYRDMGAQAFRYPVPGRRGLDMKKLRVIGGNQYSSLVSTIEPKSRRPW